MWSGAGFRVSLKSERRFSHDTDPLQRAIEERAVRGTQVFWETIFVHCEAVILTRDHHAPGIQLDDGMIRTVVTKFHLYGLSTAGECQ